MDQPVRAMRLPRLGLVLLVSGLAATGLVSSARAQHYVPGADTTFPRVKYADSLVSANDRCMVRGGKLNYRVHPVYVNSVPMGFC